MPPSTSRRRLGGAALVVTAVMCLFAVACGSDDEKATPTSDPDMGETVEAPPADIPGIKTFSELSRNHVPGNVDYPQTPPVGGDHAPRWQNCGYYSQPIVEEQGVHAMEHGAVWVTYSPDLPADQVTVLRNLAKNDRYVLVSPFPGLPSPVVATAWGVQLGLPSATDPLLATFVESYSQGPQTPEPGAPCSGALGTPE